MKKNIVLICAVSMLSAPVFGAQLYRWIDERGHVEWRDTPPPATAKKIEKHNVRVGAAPAADLPYSLQLAVKNFPVTLWTTNCGDLCDRARAHLSRRGVPHAEKDPQADFEGFKKATGGGSEVPLLFIGSTRIKGYLESEWDAALDFAGYPKTALVTLKPKPKAAAKPAVNEPPPVRLYTSTDCGPQCTGARELLGSRGIKFQEITIGSPESIEELRKISADTFVPTLVAGRFVVRGFVPNDYNNALDQAGFRQEQAAAAP